MITALLVGSLSIAGALPQRQTSLIATESSLELHSHELLNLHHVLHALAGDRSRARERAIIGGSLDARLPAPDRQTWSRAVDYYALHLASRDLRTGQDMTAIKHALVRGDLGSLDAGHRAIFVEVLPVYRRTLWPAHDADNRKWTADFVERFRQVSTRVLPDLERVLAARWPARPVRVDMVWVAKPTPYSTVEPLHLVMPSTDAKTQGWWGVELMLHEAAHGLIAPVDAALDQAFRSRQADPRDTWHGALFFLTGEVLRRVLDARGIAYRPYAYETGVFDRAWTAVVPAMERHLGAYLDGRSTLQQAADAIAAESSARRQPPASGLAEFRRLHFYSDFWINLHHTLYAAAWATRPVVQGQRRFAEALPSPLESAAMTPDERAAWEQAVGYYDRTLASSDLLFGRGMERIKLALAAGDLQVPAIAADLRAALEQAAPVYRRHFWPAHDRRNRAWIDVAMPRLREVGEDVIARLEKFYGVPWFTSDVRMDVVWVGNFQGAYTTVGPPVHAVISTADRANTDWMAVELVFHEISHSLVLPLEKELSAALGRAVREHPQFWHVVQFYLTGSAVEQALAARKIDYRQMLFTGLLDRAWPRYREALEQAWPSYVQGKSTRAEAIAASVRALKAPAVNRP